MKDKYKNVVKTSLKEANDDVIDISNMEIEFDDIFKITTSRSKMQKDYKLITLGSKYKVVNKETFEISDILVSSAKDKFGKNGVEQAPYFERYDNEADNINYKIFNGRFVNSNVPLPFKPKKGTWSTIEKMLRHCCGTEYSNVLQYYCNMILHPSQRLPLILLLSSENNTGKTTMVEWTARMMGGNATKIKATDISDKFSGYHVNKQFAYVDEKLEGAHKFQDISILKDMVTAEVVASEIKNGAKINVKCNIKIMMCSNDIFNAIAMEGSDTRVWPMLVPVMSKGQEEDKDTFKRKLDSETPAFLYYLINELELPKSRGRLYFSDKEIENELKTKIKDENKPEVVVILDDIIKSMFDEDDKLTKIKCTSHQIRLVTGVKISMNRINSIFLEEGIEYLRDDSAWYEPRLLKNISPYGFKKKRGSHFTFHRI